MKTMDGIRAVFKLKSKKAKKSWYVPRGIVVRARYSRWDKVLDDVIRKYVKAAIDNVETRLH